MNNLEYLYRAAKNELWKDHKRQQELRLWFEEQTKDGKPKSVKCDLTSADVDFMQENFKYPIVYVAAGCVSVAKTHNDLLRFESLR